MTGDIISGLNTAFNKAVVYSGSSDWLGIGTFGKTFLEGFRDSFLYYGFHSLTLDVVFEFVVLFLLLLAISFLGAFFVLRNRVVISDVDRSLKIK